MLAYANPRRDLGLQRLFNEAVQAAVVRARELADMFGKDS
jgi:hypothetical protein